MRINSYRRESLEPESLSGFLSHQVISTIYAPAMIVVTKRSSPEAKQSHLELGLSAFKTMSYMNLFRYY
jgi:hypothetical protein